MDYAPPQMKINECLYRLEVQHMINKLPIMYLDLSCNAVYAHLLALH